MKKYSIEMHWFKGGYKKTALWAEDIEAAVHKARLKAPKGYAVTKVREVRPTAEELKAMETAKDPEMPFV